VACGDERTFAIEGTSLNTKDEGTVPGSPFFSRHAKWDWDIVNEHPRSSDAGKGKTAKETVDKALADNSQKAADAKNK
jgi:hypothetical protein